MAHTDITHDDLKHYTDTALARMLVDGTLDHITTAVPDEPGRLTREDLDHMTPRMIVAAIRNHELDHYLTATEDEPDD